MFPNVLFTGHYKSEGSEHSGGSNMYVRSLVFSVPEITGPMSIKFGMSSALKFVYFLYVLVQY